MPAACAADLREELLARVWGPTIRAASRQDAEPTAEMDALEAAGALTPPDDWELCGLVADPRCGPPDGADAWLADLPAELLFEYLAATEDQPCREAIVAGRLPRQPGDGCGFAAGGAADELPPGPVLAGLAGDAWSAGLGRLSDDELVGVLRAARRLASWSAALELAAVTDLATRREAEAAGAGPSVAGEHIGDEIATALTLTARAADVLLDLAIALRRLPATMTALAAGRIDRYRAAVIADEVGGLGDEHAAAVEQRVLDDAPGQTTGQLRAATRRAVLAANPAAARERKERAGRDARVERWDEHAGTAALAGRDLPPADVLAADHNLSALAGSLRRAGVNGTMDQLRAKAYLALLTGQPITALTGRGGVGRRRLRRDRSRWIRLGWIRPQWIRPRSIRPRRSWPCWIRPGPEHVRARVTRRGEPDHAPGDLARPVRRPGPRRRIRATGRRRLARPSRPAGHAARQPLVHHADRRGRKARGPRLRPNRPHAVRALPAPTPTLTAKPSISPPHRHFAGLARRRQRMAGRDHRLQTGDG
jgi:hypothetical protein